MSKMKNTPWKAVAEQDDEPPYLWSVLDSQDNLVFFGMDEEVARLFAAAPDLLAFAKEVKRRCEIMGLPNHQFCTMADVGISKATALSA